MVLTDMKKSHLATFLLYFTTYGDKTGGKFNIKVDDRICELCDTREIENEFIFLCQ